MSDWLDGDAAVGEPGQGALDDSNGDLRFLV